jgi:hypothetical protein
MSGTGLDCAANIPLPSITNKPTKRANLIASPPREVVTGSKKRGTCSAGATMGGVSVAERPNCTPAQPLQANEARRRAGNLLIPSRGLSFLCAVVVANRAPQGTRTGQTRYNCHRRASPLPTVVEIVGSTCLDGPVSTLRKITPAIFHRQIQAAPITDNSLGHGYEPWGREFESLRAHHI